MTIAPSIVERLKLWAGLLRAELIAISRAARDPRTPWLARLLALLVVAYAVSPIDLIPDFIPVLGLLDDLILIPLGLALVLRFIPPEVIAEHRAVAANELHVQPRALGLAIVVGIWVFALVALALWIKGRV
jgi:uncharacterized membrane protein YkvA (DUF1232 family)